MCRNFNIRELFGHTFAKDYECENNSFLQFAKVNVREKHIETI